MDKIIDELIEKINEIITSDTGIMAKQTFILKELFNFKIKLQEEMKNYAKLVKEDNKKYCYKGQGSSCLHFMTGNECAFDTVDKNTCGYVPLK